MIYSGYIVRKSDGVVVGDVSEADCLPCYDVDDSYDWAEEEVECLPFDQALKRFRVGDVFAFKDEEPAPERITIEMIRDLQNRLKASEGENARIKQYVENTHLGLTAFVTLYEMQSIHGAGSHAALPENCLTTVQRTALAGLTEKKEV